MYVGLLNNKTTLPQNASVYCARLKKNHQHSLNTNYTKSKLYIDS